MSTPGCDISIVGAGGHASVVIAALVAGGGRPGKVFDDSLAAPGERLVAGFGVEPTPAPSWWQETERAAHLAIGSNAARQTVSGQLRAQWASIIHPSAVIDPTAQIGCGVFVSAGAIIQANARIGDHSIINTGAIVEHDCEVGRFVHLAPRTSLCGGVEIGEGALVGVGTNVIPLRRIGAWTIIGAGSTVVRDIPDRVTAYGCPARIISSRS